MKLKTKSYFAKLWLTTKVVQDLKDEIEDNGATFFVWMEVEAQQ